MKKKKLISCPGMRKQYFVGIICGARVHANDSNE